jgi:hypothetical protein
MASFVQAALLYHLSTYDELTVVYMPIEKVSKGPALMISSRLKKWGNL